MNMYKLTRRALFLLEPEFTHNLSLMALRAGILLPSPDAHDPRLKVSAFGLDFPNPLGMAAGYDKNGEVIDQVLKLGFGHIEIGTVTPRPQGGNPRPRLFRLPHNEAVINRMGFNNNGHAAMRERLAARAAKGKSGIVGVNLGANKDSTDRVADYVAGIHVFADLASYFAINVSSPNTPGLRDLQTRAHLGQLLSAIMAARDEAAAKHGHKVPVLLKIAPDMHVDGFADIAAEVRTHRVEGLIVSNTTLARDTVTDEARKEAGGLSGKPLFERSTRALAQMRHLVGPDLPIVGVGGIDSVETAYAKIAAGATLIQLYTGLIYEGPELADTILTGLGQRLHRDGVESIQHIVGRDMGMWL